MKLAKLYRARQDFFKTISLECVCMYVCRGICYKLPQRLGKKNMCYSLRHCTKAFRATARNYFKNESSKSISARVEQRSLNGTYPSHYQDTMF